MVCRNRWFDLRPGFLFTNTVDLIDCSRSITNVHQPRPIKSHSCRNTQISGEGDGFFEWRKSIDNAVQSARYEHLTVVAKRYSSWVGNIARILRNDSTDTNAKERYGQLLPSRT